MISLWILKVREAQRNVRKTSIWSFAGEASAAAAKTLSIGNLKQVFTNEGRWFLDHAVQVKNIWVPNRE